MIYLNSLDKIDLKNTALTIGKFEAIHKGHKVLIDSIVNKKNLGYTACVLSVRTDTTEIYTKEERLCIFQELGVDVVVDLELADIKNIAYDNFIKNIIIDKFGVKYVACGDDFNFGKDKKGNAHILKEFLETNGCECSIFEKIRHKNKVISSSLVKEYILNGEINEANEILTKDFFILGKVIEGNQIGRTIGVPTANVLWSNEKILPPKGVYSVKVVLNNEKFYGIANIGVKPTISNDNQPLIETNIFDFDKNIYGKDILVYLNEFIRKEQKYSSVYELEQTIKKDILYIKKNMIQ